MFWVFLSFFLFFSTPVTRKGFLRVSFCTFRVLVRTTDVQRNATATTRFADGSWTPPKAAAAEAAATAAAARTQAVAKASLSFILSRTAFHSAPFAELLCSALSAATALCCCCCYCCLGALLVFVLFASFADKVNNKRSCMAPTSQNI